jgi:hypothetical protein
VLSQQAQIRFPKGKKGWDYTTVPPLPHWLEVIREKAQAAKPNMDQIPWPPELAFASMLKNRTHLEALRLIQEWLAAGGRKAIQVPIKERSAEIFGDEKRLDRLLKTDLFAPGRLTLETLRCYPVYPNLVWERGSAQSPSILILENSNTYHSFCAWNAETAEYAACVYGHGFMIHHTYLDLQRVLDQTNPSAAIHYFGDLDVTGIRIPIELSRLLEQRGLPKATPAERWYGFLLDMFPEAQLRIRKKSPGNWTHSDLSWFSRDLQERVKAVFELGFRVPQELVGTDCLKGRVNIEQRRP